MSEKITMQPPPTAPEMLCRAIASLGDGLCRELAYTAAQMEDCQQGNAPIAPGTMVVCYPGYETKPFIPPSTLMKREQHIAARVHVLLRELDGKTDVKECSSIIMTMLRSSFHAVPLGTMTREDFATFSGMLVQAAEMAQKDLPRAKKSLLEPLINDMACYADLAQTSIDGIHSLLMDWLRERQETAKKPDLMPMDVMINEFGRRHRDRVGTTMTPDEEAQVRDRASKLWMDLMLPFEHDLPFEPCMETTGLVQRIAEVYQHEDAPPYAAANDEDFDLATVLKRPAVMARVHQLLSEVTLAYPDIAQSEEALLAAADLLDEKMGVAPEGAAYGR